METTLDSNSRERPKSVTIISWLLIIISLVGWFIMIGGFIYISNQPNIKLASPVLFLSIPTLSSGFQIILGIGMLKGHEWARKLFFWVIPISVVFGIAFGNGLHAGILVKAVWYFIFVYVLTRTAATAYFNNKNITSGVKTVVKQCPKCAEEIKLEALVCRYCGHQFDEEEVATIIAKSETEIKRNKESLRAQESLKKKKIVRTRMNLYYKLCRVSGGFLCLLGIFLAFLFIASIFDNKTDLGVTVFFGLFSSLLILPGIFMFKKAKKIKADWIKLQAVFDEVSNDT